MIGSNGRKPSLWSHVLYWGRGYPSQVLGQGYPLRPPPTRTRIGEGEEGTNLYKANHFLCKKVLLHDRKKRTACSVSCPWCVFKGVCGGSVGGDWGLGSWGWGLMGWEGGTSELSKYNRKWLVNPQTLIIPNMLKRDGSFL